METEGSSDVNISSHRTFDFSSSINDSRTSDLTVSINKWVEFKVHRIIVESSSNYFKSLKDFQEGKTGRLSLQFEDVSPGDFSLVLRWLYGAEIAFSVDRLDKVYRLACYLQIRTLKNFILKETKRIVKTGTDVLKHKITYRSLLNDITPHIKIRKFDSLQLLILARDSCSDKLHEACQQILASGDILERDMCVSHFKRLTSDDLKLIFSSDKMHSLDGEDEVLELMQNACSAATLCDEDQTEVATLVRFQNLSRKGIGRAIAWDAINKLKLSNCLLNEMEDSLPMRVFGYESDEDEESSNEYQNSSS